MAASSRKRIKKLIRNSSKPSRAREMVAGLSVRLALGLLFKSCPHFPVLTQVAPINQSLIDFDLDRRGVMRLVTKRPVRNVHAVKPIRFRRDCKANRERQAACGAQTHRP